MQWYNEHYYYYGGDKLRNVLKYIELQILNTSHKILWQEHKVVISYEKPLLLSRMVWEKGVQIQVELI